MSKVLKYVIANWKMHGRHVFVKDWCEQMPDHWSPNVKVVVAPPYAYIPALKALASKALSLGSQDVSIFKEDGAHTGDLSAAMLEDIGCEYVIIGHSERRALGETDAQLKSKLENVKVAGLTPVFCVGESLQVRQGGRAWDFVAAQLELIADYPKDLPLIIAYEPIWAIGTGETASVEDVEHMHGLILGRMSRPVLYGGSVKASNAKELMGAQGVSGALVGGASLKPLEFFTIVDAAS